MRELFLDISRGTQTHEPLARSYRAGWKFEEIGDFERFPRGKGVAHCAF